MQHRSEAPNIWFGLFMAVVLLGGGIMVGGLALRGFADMAIAILHAAK